MTKKKPMLRSEDLGGKPPTETKKKWTPSPGTSPTIGTRIEKGLRADFDAISKKEGVYTSDLLRWLIRTFVEDYNAGRVELPKKPREPEAPFTLE